MRETCLHAHPERRMVIMNEVHDIIIIKDKERYTMEIKQVKASEFNNEVLKSDKPVLVDFWADWCGPCKMLGPVLEQVAAKVDDVQIVKINVDEESSVAEKYNIMSIPTLLLFKNGECVAKSVGFISEGQVMEFIGK